MNDTSTYREKAGVLVSALIVLALIAVGPIQMSVQVFTGQNITFEPTWMATVAGLAGTAFGFLIGKQTTNQAASTTTTVTPATVTTTIAGDPKEAA